MKSLVIAVLVALAALVWWATSASRLERTRAPLELVGHEDASNAPAAPLGSVRELADVSSESIRKEASSVVRGAGIHLFGSISREDGHDVSANSVAIRLLDDRANDLPTRLKADSTYSYTGLRAGHVWLNIDAIDACAQSLAIDLRANETERRVDVVLASRARIKVRCVTPGGKRLSRSSSVTLRGEPTYVRELEFIASTSELLASSIRPKPIELGIVTSLAYARCGPVETGDEFGDIGYSGEPRVGNLEIGPESSNVPDGYVAVLECNRSLPLWISAVRGMNVLTSQLVPLNASEVVYVLGANDIGVRRSLVRLTILDDVTREPVVGAFVDFQSRRARMKPTPPSASSDNEPTESDPLGLGPEPEPLFSSITDDHGNVQLDGVRVGWNEMYVTDPRFEYLTQWIDVGDSRQQDLGSIALRPRMTIEGRMVDENENEIVGAIASVRYDATESSRRPPAPVQTPGFGPGVFKLEKIGRGRNIVWVRCANWVSRPIVVDTSTGPVKDVVLHCAPPAKVAILVPPTIASDAVVRVETDDGLPVFDEFKSARERIDVTLAKGKYVVRIRRGKERIVDRAFEVRGDGLTVDLTR